MDHNVSASMPTGAKGTNSFSSQPALTPSQLFYMHQCSNTIPAVTVLQIHLATHRFASQSFQWLRFRRSSLLLPLPFPLKDVVRESRVPKFWVPADEIPADSRVAGAGTGAGMDQKSKIPTRNAAGFPHLSVQIPAYSRATFQYFFQNLCACLACYSRQKIICNVPWLNLHFSGDPKRYHIVM
jgi:hypothetical protein